MSAVTTRWEPVVGIEVHVELRTESKMFCGCAVSFGQTPNSNICPTCLALPGALPVTNRKAIDSIIAIGISLNCEINEHSIFHRKNYFYTDLPKNYQISQFDLPVATDGWLEVDGGEGKRKIRIERAHMEEDTGKSTHVGAGGRIHTAEKTLIDFNRAGTPLVEIVSRPDIHSAPEARAYAQELRALVAELGVSDARMEEGSIRFDANVSIRPEGSAELGTKVEIKNMNSFRSLERAVDHELERQVSAQESDEVIFQETRHWDEASGTTTSMRGKEGSADYRYFPDPDLVPLRIDSAWVDRIRESLPELPATRRSRYEGLGLDAHNAAVLAAAEPKLRQIYDAAVEAGADAATAAIWTTGEVTAWLRRTETDPEQIDLDGPALAKLVNMIEQGEVSASAAKEVLDGVLSGEGSPKDVAAARDLIQVSDRSAVEEIVAAVLADNPGAVTNYQEGEQKVIGFLVGQVMRTSGGKADPKLANEILREKLAR
ncbi:MAG: Asp-tRNA(Asn)/Glu-tRNA(Gln) amidotransferase subunit GatB [Acidimicrobiia bacterium]|nr:Asp-tRNA(Asn)/Glu-tRNA(Gln) amidotransferase subunit GatB [Acidimicrobiia bacterium]